jgi:hypothetical protein
VIDSYGARVALRLPAAAAVLAAVLAVATLPTLRRAYERRQRDTDDLRVTDGMADPDDVPIARADPATPYPPVER